jgi:transposase
MHKKHTEEEWAKALEMYQKGYGSIIISRATGIDDRDLRHQCRMYDMTGKWHLEREKRARSNAKIKIEAVNAVVQQSLSLAEVTVKYGISRGCLQSWLRKFRLGGYEAFLATKPKERPPKMPKPRKSNKAMSEVELLKERIAYLEAENAYLKKLKALDQEENAEMFGIGPRSSEN